MCLGFQTVVFQKFIKTQKIFSLTFLTTSWQTLKTLKLVWEPGLVFTLMKPEISFILTVLLPDGSRINIFPGWLQILRFACQSIQEEFLNFRLCIILDFHVYLKFFLFYFWHETFPGIQFNPVTSNYENALLWDEAFCRRHKMPLCMADLQDACTILGKVMNFKC